MCVWEPDGGYLESTQPDSNVSTTQTELLRVVQRTNFY